MIPTRMNRIIYTIVEAAPDPKTGVLVSPSVDPDTRQIIYNPAVWTMGVLTETDTDFTSVIQRNMLALGDPAIDQLRVNDAYYIAYPAYLSEFGTWFLGNPTSGTFSIRGEGVAWPKPEAFDPVYLPWWTSVDDMIRLLVDFNYIYEQGLSYPSLWLNHTSVRFFAAFIDDSSIDPFKAQFDMTPEGKGLPLLDPQVDYKTGDILNPGNTWLELMPRIYQGGKITVEYWLPDPWRPIPLTGPEIDAMAYYSKKGNGALYMVLFFTGRSYYNEFADFPASPLYICPASCRQIGT